MHPSHSPSTPIALHEIFKIDHQRLTDEDEPIGRHSTEIHVQGLMYEGGAVDHESEASHQLVRPLAELGGVHVNEQIEAAKQGEPLQVYGQRH